MKNILACLILVVTVVSVVESAKILGIFMIPSRSHQLVYQPIWRELSLRGHEVTVFTPDPLNDPSLTNLTEIDMSYSYDVLRNIVKNSFETASKSEEVKRLFDAFTGVFDAQMSSPEIQKLLANESKEKYDLFLVEYIYQPMYAFKDVLNCPMVGITSLHMTLTGLESLGMVKHPALDPDLFLPFSTDLSFKERVISTIFYILYKVRLWLIMAPEFNAATRKYFGPSTRDLAAIARDVSIVLGNYNYVSQNVRPNVPAFVDISGIHLHSPKPLPEDLEKFLDESKEGVVYFSFGSNVKTSLLPSDKLNTIVSAFAKLEYRVLFKFDADLQNITSVPNNVQTRKWFPQQDLLKHPNVKLFVTQGGLQSIDEAIYSKVPLLIIPIFGDQRFNAHKMVKSGVGLSIDFTQLTKNELIEKINEIIQNPEYKKTISKLGDIAFDQQVPPLEKAVWWIEYGLRHNGAPHLKYKGVDMPFYQFYLLDVFCFLGFILALTSYVILKVAKKLIFGFKFLSRNKQSKESSKKSQ